MSIFKFLAIALMVVGLSACGSKFKTYKGPEVTHVVVNKTERKMYLLHHSKVLDAYDFELGFAPDGHKYEEGDGRTPEGAYFIDRKNPESRFYLSIGISYPNDVDRAKAAEMGQPPGGDIFIHGTPREFRRAPDWTWGCLAVKNREMEDIYAMVNVGTPIFIYP